MIGGFGEGGVDESNSQGVVHILLSEIRRPTKLRLLLRNHWFNVECACGQVRNMEAYQLQKLKNIS